ncbi:polymerase delta-interacting protein 3 [Chionoecetes opilio]|uniref:Polymerase delta-interacting protein 3 n=1 Tax=Chionoecetes opilio TaxID=41210 RepID=A0A8J8WN18_CHIOP|nr:polymerase delta-interacting protein 3 [Chionoecetes opilio]
MPARHPPPRPPAPRPMPARLPEPEPERMAVRVPAKKRPMYNEKQLEPLRHPKKVASISSGLMARLDQPQRPSPMQGTKVLVTNLHECVSVEDMEELFGTIGSILSARMVREGAAEAVFMSEDDAFSGGTSSVMRPRATNPAIKRQRPVTPNITAIHEALFNRSQPPTSDQVFLVKLPRPPTKKTEA